MLVVILGMLVCITLAMAVLGLVAVPAARDGEVLFLPREDAASARPAETAPVASVADLTAPALDEEREAVPA